MFLTSGGHGPHEIEFENWYVSGTGKSLPFYVGIRSPQRDEAGLEVEVAYDFDTYRWRVSESKKYISEFTDSMSKWWIAYQRQHPGGPLISRPESQLN